MTGQQLKYSILQEAIQGRLVPNVLEPGEKTGAGLLQDLFAERQKKENTERGKKAKRITLSTIEEEPWELPEEWCWCLLPNVATIEYGFPFDSTKFNSTRQGTPLIRIRDVVPGYTKTYTTESASKEYLVRKGDMLTGMDGNFNVNFWDSDDAYLNQRVCRITANKQIIEQRYLYYYLPIAFKKIEEGVSFVTVKHLSDKHLKALAIPLPPRSVQRKIVEILDGVVPQIEAFDKAAGELETLNKILPDKLRKSVLQEAIHGNLVPNDIPEGEATGAELLQQILKERQDRENKETGKKAKKLTLSTIEEEPWELPKGWCWCRIDDIAFVTKLAGFEYSKYIAPNLAPDGIPLFKGKNVQNGKINYTFESYIPKAVSDNLERSRLSKKCILTPYVGTIGNVALFDARFEAHLGSNVGKIELDNDTILNEYVIYYLRCEDGLKQLKKHLKATAQESISIDAIRDVYIPIPPLSVQHRIVEKIEEVFSVIGDLHP